MPRIIAPSPGEAIELDEVVARLEERGVDFAREDHVDYCADLLARLGRNRTFLADRVFAALKASFDDQLAANRYSAQVFLLHRSGRRFFLRANLWPSASDYAYQSSGPAPFAYELPHDHNFNFLTTGYFGPGYISDYYEYDAESVEGYADEPLALTFVERSALGEGKVQLYRAHRDIHRQLPPESLSVSLNIMEEGEYVPWRDQYIVDLDRRTIARSQTLTQTEMLLRCAVHFGGNGQDIADQIARAHPVPRVRAQALAAQAAAEDCRTARVAVLERGLYDPSRRVQAECAALLIQCG